jgi:endoglucanase
MLFVFVLLLLTVGGASAQDEWLAPPEIEGEAVYIPFPVAITVDGDLSDWGSIQPITVARGPNVPSDPMDNGSFTFGVAADNENFYIYMTSPDKNIITGQHGGDYWNEDSLEFYLNVSGNRFAPSYVDGVFQINIKPLDIGPAALTITGSSSTGVPVQGFVFATDDGWGFEASVSLAQLGVTPVHGLEIGFQTQANGATTQDRDAKLIWSLADTGDTSWQNPSLFGSGLFFEVGSTDIPLPSERAPEPEPEPVMPAGPTVRTNQLGYFTTGPKIAVHVADQGMSASWELVNTATSETVLTGTTSAAIWDEASGDFVQQIDFSEWAEPGEYILSIGSDESAPFTIGNDIYSQLAVDALRYFYLTRSGIELTSDLAGDWARPAGHLSDANVTCYSGVDPQGVEWPGCDYSIDGSGGWYDAGDYGKYVVNGGITVWTLLDLYERFPQAFPDGSANIPESGNGVPDILDEARWEMEWMLRMQVPEGDPLAGMAFHKLHDISWAGMPVLPPTETEIERFVYPPSTAATLNLAATAAQCARVWADIDPEFSAQCLTAAQTAWEAALANPNLYAGNVPGGGGGNYDDTSVSDDFLWAAAELYVTTQDPAYQEYVDRFSAFVHFPGPSTSDSSSMYWGETGALGLISLAMVDGNETYQRDIISTADAYLEQLDEAGYRLPMGISGYVWGSNSGVMNNALVLALAYDFTGDPAYLDGTIAAMDYVLGRNALSFSYITGYGVHSPEHVHHRFWGNQGDYPPPPPGVLAGGANADPSDPDSLANAILDSGPAKRYVDMYGAYSTNEVAINWNAPLMWVTAYLDQQFNGD